MLVVLLSQNTLKNSEKLPTYHTVESGNSKLGFITNFFYYWETFTMTLWFLVYSSIVATFYLLQTLLPKEKPIWNWNFKKNYAVFIM